MKNKMKQTFFLLAIFLLNGILYSNPITSEPSFPTKNDSIIIYFDATKGNQDLMGFTGDVYAHTGVLTAESANSGDWKYIIADWNVNIAAAKLTCLSTDHYKLVIGDLFDYYAIPADTIVEKLCFVFRSSDGSKEGKDVGDTDIFLPIYTSGISTILITPENTTEFGIPERSPIFATSSDTISVSATAAANETKIDSMFLFMNNIIQYSTDEDTLNYNLDLSSFSNGRNLCKIVSKDTANIVDTLDFIIMINEVPTEENRATNIKDGINYIDDNTVTLSLFAPYKDFVYVIGDFNNWEIDENYYMETETIDTNSVHYWLTITGLIKNVEYGFQYFVDGEIRIADPYTEKVLDEDNDEYISEATYPSLKSYPKGKTEHIVSVFETGQTDYTWETNSYKRPNKEKLVIYELLVRDFVNAHNYQTLIDTLDYLDSLGITAIELMPVNEFEGNNSWGYNPSFYFAPDKYYGPANDLKRFIDECHSRGIAVIMDIVLNHSYGQSPLVRLYDHGNHTTSLENPWYNEEHNFTNPDAQWGYDFDHESLVTQYFVDRVNRYWITEYKIDGFRFDFTKGFTNNIKEMDDPWGSIYDPDRVRLLKRMADRIWATDSSVYVIMEHLAENQEEEELADYEMMLWGNSSHDYQEAAMGYNADFSWGYYNNRGWSEPNLVTYMESHDEERLMYKNLQYGNSSGSYNIKLLATALDRIKLNAAFFLTLPGPKMIWQFGELGYDYSIDYNGRIGEKPIKWEYLQDDDRKSLYDTYRSLLKIRNENEVFTSPNTSINFTLGQDDNVKSIKISGTPNVVIFGNFGVDSYSEIDVGFFHGDEWYDYFSGDTINADGYTDKIDLAPGEFHIFTDQKLELPTGVENPVKINENDQIVKSFKLSQNYPNPFNPTTTINYQLPADGFVTLILYNLLGEKIQILDYGTKCAGNYSYKLNAENLATGIYFYKIDFKNKNNLKIFSETKKLILLK